MIDTGEKLIPVEIKASKTVRPSDVRGLARFLDDYGVAEGFVVFRGESPEKISAKITAIPWRCL